MRILSLAASVLSLGMLLPTGAGAGEWLIDTKASFVEFAYLENEEPKTGRFGMINPRLTLDPDNLHETRGVLGVEVASLDLSDPLREGILATKPWLDAKNFPDALFEIERLVPGDRPDQATAIGNLEIKGVSMPLSVPIVIVRQGGHVKASGALRFDRIDYGLRDAIVESIVKIDDEIVLDFELVARLQ